MSSVGSRLRDERKRRRMSQAEFAAWGGVQKGAQVNYEADRRRPDAGYLEQIAQHGVDVNYVLTGAHLMRGADFLTQGVVVPFDAALMQSCVTAAVRQLAAGLPSADAERIARASVGLYELESAKKYGQGDGDE